MKDIIVLAAFAVFAVTAMVSSVSAAIDSADAPSITASVEMPSAQDLPFDRYWSKS
jgi:hypothetical protein